MYVAFIFSVITNIVLLAILFLMADFYEQRVRDALHPYGDIEEKRKAFSK